MKKLLLLITIIIFGCNSQNVSVKDTNMEIKGYKIEVYTLDSCEYIGCDVTGKYGFFTHKGNCKYCTDRNIKIKDRGNKIEIRQ